MLIEYYPQPKTSQTRLALRVSAVLHVGECFKIDDVANLSPRPLEVTIYGYAVLAYSSLSASQQLHALATECIRR
jgi:hypothetical protein